MRAALAVWLLAGAASGAQAQPAEELPDLELLEYLGSWQEDDEEWLVVAEWERRERRRQRPEEKADEKGE